MLKKNTRVFAFVNGQKLKARIIDQVVKNDRQHYIIEMLDGSKTIVDSFDVEEDN